MSEYAKQTAEHLERTGTPMTGGGSAALRDHIIEIISYSGYSRNLKDVEKVAKRLGVLPETLVAAQKLARYRKNVAERNEESKMPVRAKSFKSKVLAVDMPNAVWDVWSQLCERRNLPSNVFLLSMLHAYLLGEYEPNFTSRHWVIGGIVHPRSMRQLEGYKRIRIHSSKAMEVALRDRVQRHGATYKMTDLVRALICKTVDGEFCRPGTFEIIKKAKVYTDPTAYVEMSMKGSTLGTVGRTPKTGLVEALDHVFGS